MKLIKHSFQILFIFLIIHLVKCGRILIIQCVPTMSYANIMSSIANILATEHEVDYLSLVNLNLQNENITFIEVKQPDNKVKSFFNDIIYEKLISDDTSIKLALKILANLPPLFIKEMLELKPFQDLLKYKPKYDLFITFSTVSEFVLQFSYYLQIPLVQVSPGLVLPWQNDDIGNPSILSLDDNLLFSEKADSASRRILRYFKTLYTMWHYRNVYIPKIDEITRNYFTDSTPSILEITKNTSLLLVNTCEAMGFVRSTVSNYVQIGGLHLKPVESLKEEFNNIYKKAGEHGVIYLSFGTTMDAKMPHHILTSFLNVLKRFPQQIIWKATNNYTYDLPSNIHFIKWCPQQDILGRNNTKLFITQGGMLSLQESVYHSVPTLIIPLAFDQFTNARIAQDVGYGKYFPFSQFSEEGLYAALKEVISDKRYTDKAREISVLMRDVQTTSKDNLKWWINYIIRHKGYPIYKNNEIKYHYAQFIDLDIVFTLAIFLILIIFLLYLLLKLLFNLVVNASLSKKYKIN